VTGDDLAHAGSRGGGRGDVWRPDGRCRVGGGWCGDTAPDGRVGRSAAG